MEEYHTEPAEKHEDPLRLPPFTMRTVLGVLAYVGPLTILPLLAATRDKFVQFHVRQGLVLLAVEVCALVAKMLFWPFPALAPFAQLAAFILSLVGIVHVLQGKEKEIPLMGQYAKHIPF